MNTFKQILIIIIVPILLFISCENNDPEKELPPPPCVFIFNEKLDYMNYVFVCLNDQKNEIIGYPTYEGIVKWDSSYYHFYKGYYLVSQGRITCDTNTAYLNITLDEYKSMDDTISIDYMEKKIIEKDPFAEYYVDEDGYLGTDCPECLEKDTVWPAIDTAKFHRLVDNNELEKYLKRLK
jgi:hypothetical protein